MTMVETVRMGVRRGPRAAWLWQGASLHAMTRNGLQAFVAPGAAPVEACALGSGRRVERGTTNLFANPSVEVDVGGIAAFGADTVARSSEQAVSGTYAAKFTRVGSAGGSFLGLSVSGWQASTTYTMTAYVRVFGGFEPSDLRLESVDLSGVSHTFVRSWTPADGNDTWIRLESRITTGAGTSGGVRIRTSGSAPAAGGGFYLDAIQLEAGAGASTYADGSLGTGHAWSGTPHASTSTRAAGGLSGGIAGFDAARGSVAVWLRPDWAAGDTSTRTLLHVRASADDGWRLYYDGASGEWRQEWHAGGTGASAAVAASHAAHDDEVVVATWAGTALQIATRSASAIGTRGSRPDLAGGLACWLGRRSDADTEHLDGVVGPVAFFDRPFSPQELTRVHRTTTPPRWR